MEIKTIYIILATIALVATWAIMPYAIRYAIYKSLYDTPDDRRVHEGLIPRIGGAVFVPVAVLATILTLLAIGLVDPSRFENRAILDIVLQLMAVMLLFVVGFIDDVWELRYRVKFLVQFIAGILLCASGIYITNLHGLLGIHEIPAFWGWTITVFAVIYCTNAMNFIDGVDGQAAMLAVTSFFYFLLVMGRSMPLPYAVLSMMLTVTLIAFLRFNLLGNPDKQRKTFMGDAGSLTLGVVMVMIAVSLNESNIPGTKPDSMFIKGFAPLLLPCLDVVRVVAHRVRNGNNPFEADKNHIHHKLMQCGLSTRVIFLPVAILNAAIITVSYLLSEFIDANAVILILTISYLVLDVCLTIFIRKIKTKT
ncbi:MAG: undecaprenyl/decaprenyl-phosphate alpha-N-acetylglucosaminyl 1-phosphate transferase [Muribaculaceae bacterium]|nr:undecaprenyl/decaprenyl-phosphate alpha-N-acetylglucosaminyl 1-phosphate transferase [Muribaculaceae bacterium]